MQTRKLAAIMFTDIVGYTSLMAKSEQQALELILKNLDIQKQAATEPNEPRILYNAMCVYSRLGVIEKALDLLESRLKDYINQSCLDRT
jgi:hypothetical protein